VIFNGKNLFLKRPILFHALLGLFIRELLASWTGHPWDFEVWVRLGKHAAYGGNPYTMLSHDPSISFSPYKEMESIGYPPLAAYIFAFSYLIYELISVNLNYDTRLIYYFILKQPIILSDVFVGVLILKNYQKRKPANTLNLSHISWLYNPYCILISSVWGALDPVSVLFVFLTVSFYETRKYLLSGITLGIAAAIKTLPLIFLTPLLINILRKNNSQRKSAVTKLLLGFIAVLLSSILVPFTVNNWSWNGFLNSMSYQANLPVYGGISPFLILEYVKQDIPFLLQRLFSSLWVILLVTLYIYLWKKELVARRSLLLTSTIFIMSRTFTSESLMLYLLLFTIIAIDEEYEIVKAKRVYSLTTVILANLIASNTLLIRFITPIYGEAFNIDIYINNTEPTASIRMAFREILALLLLQELISVVFNEEPLLPKVIHLLSTSNKNNIAGYCVFFVLTLSLGLGLDYTVIEMVTDWYKVLEKPFFLGLDLLSTYHLFLAVIFLIWILTIVLLKRGTKIEKLKTFLILLVLVIASAGTALPIFQYLKTGKVLTGESIILIKSISVQDKQFFILALSTLSTLPGIASLETLLNRIKKLKLHLR
jgi:hypothetical protein